MEPPYRRIAGVIAGQIASGDLAAGDRVPSTRELMRQYGIAMATATKVIAELRGWGLVDARGGGGWVARAAAGVPRRVATPPRGSLRALVRAAASPPPHAEGLSALSMRRLAGAAGVATMSLYRHVGDKDELLLLMLDRVFAENPPPDPAPEGWRPRLEAITRLQWALYRRHPWLAQAVSFTRPQLAPNAMAHTEWTLRALDGYGLPPEDMLLATITLAGYVRGQAVSLEAEAQAEQDSGLSDREWMERQGERAAAVLSDGRFPLLGSFIEAPEVDLALDKMMAFGLQRLLDGLAMLLPGTSAGGAPAGGGSAAPAGR
ncbi:TetR/AcrR family transcriptional regulator C-terminal domain-containing protein [Actinoplanes sp. NPDC051633]|uniref:TetR/AcrR family transcriptional regulator C-terminal domain-containing protein n=1 Tax=Actinoplanes sp. NPDC051633 TaxID=3155670 RepID=UPI00342B0BF9